jgi:hypothetical protein
MNEGQIKPKGQFSLIGETAFVRKKRTRNFKPTSAVQKQFWRKEINPFDC